ncbi:hypothetical protein BDN67DRAFT_973584 [Paxillus ammoniavirescens]|nr:hypothetical protein BDN67DRAFT_973584 [Paxillus ammoniavirescens]
MAALKASRTAGVKLKLGGRRKHSFLPPFINCRIQPEQGWRFGFVSDDHPGAGEPLRTLIRDSASEMNEALKLGQGVLEFMTCLKHAVAESQPNQRSHCWRPSGVNPEECWLGVGSRHYHCRPCMLSFNAEMDNKNFERKFEGFAVCLRCPTMFHRARAC